MNVLLVWQEDTDIRFYLLKDPNEEIMKTLIEANGTIINTWSEDKEEDSEKWNESTEKLNLATIPEKYIVPNNNIQINYPFDVKEWLGVFNQFQVEPPLENIDKIFFAGFMA